MSVVSPSKGFFYTVTSFNEASEDSVFSHSLLCSFASFRTRGSVRIRWRPEMRRRSEMRRRREMGRRPDMTESLSTGSGG